MAKRNYNGEGTIYFSEKLNRYVAQFTDPFTKNAKHYMIKMKKHLRKN